MGKRDEVWRQTYTDIIVQFLLPELPFCRQQYRDHKLAFSAPEGEQHVCLGEKINSWIQSFNTVNADLILLKLGLLKYSVSFFANILAPHQTMMQLNFLYNMDNVLIMLFYRINVFGLLSEWLNLLIWFSNGQLHVVERTRHYFNCRLH